MAGFASHPLTDLESEHSQSSQSSPKYRRPAAGPLSMAEHGSPGGSSAELNKSHDPAEPLKAAANDSTGTVAQAAQQVADMAKPATDALGLTKPGEPTTPTAAPNTYEYGVPHPGRLEDHNLPTLTVPSGDAATLYSGGASPSPNTKQSLLGRLFGRRTNDQTAAATSSLDDASTTVEPSTSEVETTAASETDTGATATSAPKQPMPAAQTTAGALSTGDEVTLARDAPLAAKAAAEGKTSDAHKADGVGEADLRTMAQPATGLGALGGLASKLPGGTDKYVDSVAKAVKDVAASKLDATQAAQVSSAVDQAVTKVQAIIPGAATSAVGGKATAADTPGPADGSSTAAGASGLGKLIDDASKAVLTGSAAGTAPTPATKAGEDTPTTAAASSAAGMAGMLAAGAAALGAAAAAKPEGGHQVASAAAGSGTAGSGGGLDKYVDQAAVQASKLLKDNVPEGQTKQVQQVVDKASTGAKAALAGKELKDLPGLVGLGSPATVAPPASDGSVGITTGALASKGISQAEEAVDKASGAGTLGVSTAVDQAKQSAIQAKDSAANAASAATTGVIGSAGTASAAAQQAAKDAPGTAAGMAASLQATLADAAAAVSSAATEAATRLQEAVQGATTGTAADVPTGGDVPDTSAAKAATGAANGQDASTMKEAFGSAPGPSLLGQIAAAVGMGSPTTTGTTSAPAAVEHPGLASLEKDLDAQIANNASNTPVKPAATGSDASTNTAFPSAATGTVGGKRATPEAALHTDMASAAAGHSSLNKAAADQPTAETPTKADMTAPAAVASSGSKVVADGPVANPVAKTDVTAPATETSSVSKMAADQPAAKAMSDADVVAPAGPVSKAPSEQPFAKAMPNTDLIAPADGTGSVSKVAAHQSTTTAVPKAEVAGPAAETGSVSKAVADRPTAGAVRMGDATAPFAGVASGAGQPAANGTAASLPQREDEAPGMGGEHAPPASASHAQAAVEATNGGVGAGDVTKLDQAAAVVKSELAAQGINNAAVHGTIDNVTAAAKDQLAGGGMAADKATGGTGGSGGVDPHRFVDQVADAVKSSVSTKDMPSEKVSQAVDNSVAAAKAKLNEAPATQGSRTTTPPDDAAKSSCFCFPRRNKAA